jgi:FkbM family methyltransferase
MNNLLEIKKQFQNQQISKPNFIDAMYEKHSELFDYCKIIGPTDIEKIEITKDGILFTSKEDAVRLFTQKADKRSAPFEIMNFDTYESDDADMLYQLIKDGDTVFDIGANIGWYSISITKKKPNTKIHAFEPIPFTFSNLVRNVALNGTEKSIITNNFGLSDKEDIITFYTSEHTTVSSSANNITEDDNTILVSCEILLMDDYVLKNGISVDFIKCDVEGAELFCFKGAINTLKTCRPIVFTEMLRKWSAKYNYHPNDIIKLFSSLGYLCFTIKNRYELRKLGAITDSTIETNFVFLHIEKHKNLIELYAEQ